MTDKRFVMFVAAALLFCLFIGAPFMVAGYAIAQNRWLEAIFGIIVGLYGAIIIVAAALEPED